MKSDRGGKQKKSRLAISFIKDFCHYYENKMTPVLIEFT